MNKLNIITIWVLSCFLQISCQGQIMRKAGKANESVSDTSSIIIDPIEPMAFVIQRETMYSFFPDSLGGKKAKGMSVIKLNINIEGKIQDFSIKKLSIYEGEKKIINFWADSSDSLGRKDYPSKVLRYYPFFKKYVDSLKIMPIIGVKPARKNTINIIVRF